jgi:hypothetical protein
MVYLSGDSRCCLMVVLAELGRLSLRSNLFGWIFDAEMVYG